MLAALEHNAAIFAGLALHFKECIANARIGRDRTHLPTSPHEGGYTNEGPCLTLTGGTGLDVRRIAAPQVSP